MGILWELALQATLEKHLAQLDCSLMWSHSFIMISKRLQEQFHACKCNCVCLCECERLCMRDCVHACVCACARVQMCTRMHVCASACIHTCVCVCMCVFMLQQLLCVTMYGGASLLAQLVAQHPKPPVTLKTTLNS